MTRKFAVAAALWAAIALSPGLAAAQAVPHPWEGAQALIRIIEADIKTGGIKSVAGHAAEIQAALGAAQALPPGGVMDGDTRYVLVDGPAQVIAASLGPGVAKPGELIVLKSVATPYPRMGYYLGSYYNEVGRFDDALKALDTGLALDGVDPPGQFRPVLVGERGAALAGLKRWSDILTNNEEGLKLPDLPDRYKARLQRGRAFALVELNRLDEGQAAYEESLKVEPGNAIATQELQYIARLKAGGKPASVELTMPNK